MKSPEHRADMERRRKKRAERRARSASLPPRDHKSRPTTTDVDKVKAAHDKREARKVKRLIQRAREL